MDARVKPAHDDLDLIGLHAMPCKSRGYILFPILFAVLAAPFSGFNIAHAQIFQTPGTFQAPGQSPVIPYPTAPPRPAPPPVYVPQVPQMNSPPMFELQNTTPSVVESDPPQANLKPLHRRKSLDKRVARCLNEAAAMGLTPNERSSYSRSCITR